MEQRCNQASAFAPFWAFCIPLTSYQLQSQLGQLPLKVLSANALPTIEIPVSASCFS